MSLPIALQIASAAIGAISALRQGSAAESAANYNAQINNQNAYLARQQAEMQASQQDRENYLRLGAIRAAQGHAGGAAGEGSVLDVLGDAAAQGEYEKQQILYRGELQARGFTNTATLDTVSGQSARSSSYYKAGSELLSGGYKAYDTYKNTKPGVSPFPTLTRV